MRCIISVSLGFNSFDLISSLFNNSNEKPAYFQNPFYLDILEKETKRQKSYFLLLFFLFSFLSESAFWRRLLLVCHLEWGHLVKALLSESLSCFCFLRFWFGDLRYLRCVDAISFPSSPFSIPAPPSVNLRNHSLPSAALSYLAL